MPSKTRKVVFARINRRRGTQDTLAARSFAEDLTELADSRLTRFEERSTGGRVQRTWFAADMGKDASGDFMTGTLGFSVLQERRTFDMASWSWVKGETEASESANEETVVPFAIDLREGQRWVAFATTARLQPAGFAAGLQQVLNEAVINARLIPTEWEVDLVVSRARVDAWLEEHPFVHMLRRTIKFTNPGKDLDEDRAEMRALGARRKTEEFKASYNGLLDVGNAAFRDKLDGTETGDLDLVMEARGGRGATKARFNSRQQTDDTLVEDFASDLMRGMEIVLNALREYVQAKRRRPDDGRRPSPGGSTSEGSD